MLVFNKTKAIPLSQLMLPKDKALSNAWKPDRQADWGLLTAFAIECTSDKFKRGEFDNIIEAFNYLANFRRVIGAILGHHSHSGMLRTSGASTPITNHEDSPYKDMYLEFCSLLERAQSDPGNLQEGIVTLRGLDISNQVFNRSAIVSTNNGYQIHHSAAGKQSLDLANDYFVKLKKNHDLSIEDKQVNTEAVLFYVSDSMPCVRGSAAVAMMLFYALEDAFTGNIRYMGHLDSLYGNRQGVTPDLAAMVSPSLSDFQAYLRKCNYDPDVKVVKPAVPLDDMMSSEKLLQDLMSMQVEAKRYDELLKKHCDFESLKFGLMQWGDCFSFLITLVNEDNDNSNRLIQINGLKNAIAKAMSQRDPYLYRYFCEDLNDRTQWPAPLNFELASEEVKDLFNKNISKLSHILNLFFNAGISLSNSKDSRDFYTLSTMSQFKIKLTQQHELLSYAIAEDAVRKYPQFPRALDILIEIVLEMDNLKNSLSKEAVVDQLFKKFYEKINGSTVSSQGQNKSFEEYIKGTQAWGVNVQKRSLNEIYDNLEEVKNGLYGYSAFQPILKLNQANLARLNDAINSPKNKAKP